MRYPEQSASAVDRRRLLSLRGIRKSYARNLVLDISHFDVDPGDSIAVVGSNGSGKSTLLRLLAGVTAPSAGELFRSAGLTRCRIAFVPQAKGLNPEFTVARNFRMYLQLYDVPAVEDLEQLPYVTALGLQDYLASVMGKLSTGYQKLVSLGTALSVAPDVIFLDEPFTGLDSSYCELVSKLVNDLAATTTLLVTGGHSPTDFPRFSRHVRCEGGVLQELR